MTNTNVEKTKHLAGSNSTRCQNGPFYSNSTQVDNLSEQILKIVNRLAPDLLPSIIDELNQDSTDLLSSLELPPPKRKMSRKNIERIHKRQKAAYRLAHYLTQQEIADRLGYARCTISEDIKIVEEAIRNQTAKPTANQTAKPTANQAARQAATQTTNQQKPFYHGIKRIERGDMQTIRPP